MVSPSEISSMLLSTALVESGLDEEFVTGGDVDIRLRLFGETVVGELRCCCCCSCSYSLISRFFSGCALFDETEVVGDAEDDTGELIVGGVFPVATVSIGLIGGLLRLDE